VRKKVEWLEFTLFKQGFTPLDIGEISLMIEYSTDENYALLAGILDMLKLIIELEDKPFGSNAFLSKEVLLSSILHYTACIKAFNIGVYDAVSDAIRYERGPNMLLPASNMRKSLQNNLEKMIDLEESDISHTKSENDCTTFSPKFKKSSYSINEELFETVTAPSVDEVVSKITDGAARIKRAEIIANVVLGMRQKWTKEESMKLRSLLLSVTDDWRSLGIRVFTCLYRLEGILDFVERGAKQYIRAPEAVRNAREALRIYAPLAQQLGLQRLKTEIEDYAFRILYKRQYKAASALYQRNSPAMKAISRYLEGEITRLLSRDKMLVNELDRIEITSRVKEPYSSWKKLVKKRFGKKTNFKLPGRLSSTGGARNTFSDEEVIPELSLMNLKDSVALRVILRARKHTPEEADEATRTREQLLCYYVQYLIRNEWPMQGLGVLKDYIQYPKPNGYQSLHYTSVLSSSGKQWPFEIQIRSDEMHRIAEYGFAAHWDYKLGEQNNFALLSGKLDDGIYSLGDNNISFPSSQLVLPPPENSYLDALVNAKQKIVKNEVFLFFAETDSTKNEKRITSLPLGAKVRDALKQLETLNDEVEYTILKNGFRVNLETIVENGDVIFITIEKT